MANKEFFVVAVGDCASGPVHITAYHESATAALEDYARLTGYPCRECYLLLPDGRKFVLESQGHVESDKEPSDLLKELYRVAFGLSFAGLYPKSERVVVRFAIDEIKALRHRLAQLKYLASKPR